MEIDNAIFTTFFQSDAKTDIAFKHNVAIWDQTNNFITPYSMITLWTSMAFFNAMRPGDIYESLNWVDNGSVNRLVSVQCQAITWTDANFFTIWLNT